MSNGAALPNQQRFFKALLVLDALHQVRGLNPEKENNPETKPIPLEDMNTQQLRRAFIDSLAFLCEHTQGGDSTTAIALEHGTDGIIYHFAANTCPHESHLAHDPRLVDDKAVFLGKLLLKLHNFASCLDLKEELFQLSKKHATKKIKNSWGRCSRQFEAILPKLHASSISYRELAKCLEKLLFAAGPENYKPLCYLSEISDKVLNSEAYKLLQRRAKMAPDSQFWDSLGKADHYIRRLLGAMKAVEVLMKAIQSPELQKTLFNNKFEVRRKFSYPLLETPLQASIPTFLGLVKSLSSTQQLSNSALRRLDKELNLSTIIRENALVWKTRVHAEIILLQYFHTKGSLTNLVANDLYIGCSKPACYCCWLYMKEHNKFEIAATPGKVYRNWRPVPKNQADGEFFKEQETFLQKMSQTMEKEILEIILEMAGPDERNIFLRPL